MRPLPGDDELRRLLAGRVSRDHIDARLSLEARGPQPALGTRQFLEPVERWLFSETALRRALKLLGLYRTGRRNALAVRVTSNTLSLRGLPGAFRGFRLLHISDPHLDMNEDLPAAITQCIAGLDYDVTVLTGDYRYATFGALEPSLRALARVRESLEGPIYAVLGNHDSLRVVPLLEDMGMRVLLNESIAVERDGDRLFLAGVDDPHYFRLADPRRARAGIPDSATSILLAHSPEVYEEAAAAGFDALLCGHTHGGQIRLPGEIPLLYNARCPRRICAGAWTYDGLAGYTSVGAGASLIDVRLNCPPEIVLHTLAPA